MTDPQPLRDASRAGDLPLSPAYRALLQSDRVNARLRTALLARGEAGPPADGSGVLDGPGRAALRAILARVVPQPPGAPDLAAPIEARLASGRGDGWRYDVLPADAKAYRAALRMLAAAATRRHGHGIAALPGEAVDALLRAAEDGSLAAEPGAELDGEALARWFEDLRADAVRTYMALPTTLDRIGFSGIGAGGDGAALRGFTRFGIGIEEGWEPRAHRDGSPS
jgi:hypothetical protein